MFEELEFGPDDRTVDGIMTSLDGPREILNAWFKDVDGNWIGFVQQPPEPGEEPAEPGIHPSLAASNLDRARAWYTEKLGLEPYRDYDGELLVYRSGADAPVDLRDSLGRHGAGTPWPSGTWTTCEPRSRHCGPAGSSSRSTTSAPLRTIDGISTESDGSLNAWFTDSEGSILGLVAGQGDHMT